MLEIHTWLQVIVGGGIVVWIAETIRKAIIHIFKVKNQVTDLTYVSHDELKEAMTKCRHELAGQCDTCKAKVAEGFAQGDDIITWLVAAVTLLANRQSITPDDIKAQMEMMKGRKLPT